MGKFIDGNIAIAKFKDSSEVITNSLETIKKELENLKNNKHNKDFVEKLTNNHPI